MDNTECLTLDDFTNSAKIIARECGVHIAYNVLEQYGGQEFYIAEHPTANHAASKKLGLDVHLALAALWGGQRFELPLLKPVLVRLRNKGIVKDSHHMSKQELIRKYKLSRKDINRIIKENDSMPVEGLFNSPEQQVLF